MPVAIPHGPTSVYGYRIGNLGYITDAKELPEDALRAFRGVDVLVLNALFRTPHPTHLSVGQALEVAAKVRPGRTLFTHICHELPQAAEAELPDGVGIAYDGLKLHL